MKFYVNGKRVWRRRFMRMLTKKTFENIHVSDSLFDSNPAFIMLRLKQGNVVTLAGTTFFVGRQTYRVQIVIVEARLDFQSEPCYNFSVIRKRVET